MIDLHKLHHFVVLAHTANFGRAAEQLYLSQSALTRSIQSLERALSTRLFDRGPSGVSLTRAGTRLVERAEDLLYDAKQLEEEVTLAADDVAGEVRFAIGPMTAGSLLPTLISQVVSQYPRVSLAVTSGSHGEMETKLLAGEVDFMVSRVDANLGSDRIQAEPLGVSMPCFLVRAGHPLTRSDGLSAEQLAQYPLIATASWNEALLYALAPDAHQWFRSCVSLDNPQILLRAAETSDAVVVGNPHDDSPALETLSMRAAGIEVRGVPIGMLRLGSRRLTPAARLVDDLLSAQIRAAYTD